jgi:hypothetical protein
MTCNVTGVVVGPDGLLFSNRKLSFIWKGAEIAGFGSQALVGLQVDAFTNNAGEIDVNLAPGQYLVVGPPGSVQSSRPLSAILNVPSEANAIFGQILDQTAPVTNELLQEVLEALADAEAAAAAAAASAASISLPLAVSSGGTGATTADAALSNLGLTATASQINASARALSTVVALLADTDLTYTAGEAGTVTAGDIVRTRAEGFSYSVAASSATDHHIATAGGLKLYALPPYNVKAFGAVGDGVADDTAAFQNAVAAGRPVYVPFADDFYSVTSLTDSEIKALFGPGTIKQSSSLVWISSNANPLNNEAAGLSYVDPNFQPAKWSSVDGSLRNGATNVLVKRTGGFGSYGLNLTSYLVDAPVPSPQFDVGQTAWVSATNLTGGQMFGAWFGANTPSSSLSQTYSSGNAIAMELNVGNRWGDFGLQADTNVLRCTVGLQIVPDVLPSVDGPTVPVYPGTFGVVYGASIHGHKWWTCTLIRPDTIMPSGIAHQANGGSTALLAPASWAKVSNHWGYALDLEGGVFATAPINFPFSATSSTATVGGVPSPGNFQGFLKVAVSGVIVKIPYYNN